MMIRYLAFSDRGEALAVRMAEAMGGEVTRSSKEYKSKDWTADHFAGSNALVYVGASGIAVRSIAPYVTAKDQDPAVLVVDESGNYVISLLSGHLGGANDLARKLAKVIEAIPVITTATDVNGIWAVDSWARVQGCSIDDKSKILPISSTLLAGKRVTLRTEFDIEGEVANGVELTEGPADITLGVHRAEGLNVIPRVVALGIGCRKDTSVEKIREAWDLFQAETRIWETAVKQVASIDLKKEEPGLKEFAREHDWPFATYSAEVLEQAPGKYNGSDFVRKITGTDNVCERSAVIASGGRLIAEKFSHDGVTFAAAVEEFKADWRDKDE